jgi:hypothetical protein
MIDILYIFIQDLFFPLIDEEGEKSKKKKDKKDSKKDKDKGYAALGGESSPDEDAGESK